MKRPGRARGFTLVELLVVIGIIGVLVMILVPVFSKATDMVRAVQTRSVLKQIEFGLKMFKSDFGAYPPSRPFSAVDPQCGQKSTGAANLPYYLRGPAGSGWGMAAAGLMPFGLTTTPGVYGGTARRSYGPYFQTSDDRLKITATADGIVGILDAFVPPGVILYLRGNLDPTTGASTYAASDNGPSPDGKTNYASQERFDDCVLLKTLMTSQYVRPEYFLVSPGADGRYGYVKNNTRTGEIAPVPKNYKLQQDEVLVYDDLGNWN